MYTINLAKKDGDMEELVKNQDGFILLSVKGNQISQRVKGLDFEKYTNIILGSLCEQMDLDPHMLAKAIANALTQDLEEKDKLLN